MLAPSNGTLTTERRPLSALSAIVNEWRALAARAAEPNPFYEPAFALAAAPVFGAGADAVLVWTGTRRLVGLFPFRLDRWRYGVPFPILTGWTHPFAPLGAPLIDGDFALPAVTAFLDHIARRRALSPPLLIPLLCEGGPVAAAFDAALAARRAPQQTFGRHARAFLLPHPLDKPATAISGHRRRRLGQQRRRLEERGALAFATVTAPGEIPDALPEFLAVEASGWKGRAGTAAAQTPAIRGFVLAAANALAAEGKVSVVRLTLDGRAIACAIVFRSGGGAWIWKVAYDEAYARFSPGVMMMVELSETLARDAGVAFVDSCAGADHPMIDRVWDGRRIVADRLIGPAPGPRFDLACRLEALRRRAFAAAKALRARLRA